MSFQLEKCLKKMIDEKKNWACPSGAVSIIMGRSDRTAKQRQIIFNILPPTLSHFHPLTQTFVQCHLLFPPFFHSPILVYFFHFAITHGRINEGTSGFDLTVTLRGSSVLHADEQRNFQCKWENQNIGLHSTKITQYLLRLITRKLHSSWKKRVMGYNQSREADRTEIAGGTELKLPSYQFGVLRHWNSILIEGPLKK